MTIWDFFNQNWFLGFLALCFSYHTVTRLIRLPILLIWGWPKLPYDADGDIHYENKEDN